MQGQEQFVLAAQFFAGQARRARAAGNQLQLQRRAEGRRGLHHLAQHRRAHVLFDADLQRRLFPVVLEAGQQPAGIGHHALRLGVQRAGILGHLHAPGLAHEQRGAQGLLKRLDAAGQGRLAKVNGARGGGDVARLEDCDEGAKLTIIHGLPISDADGCQKNIPFFVPGTGSYTASATYP